MPMVNLDVWQTNTHIQDKWTWTHREIHWEGIRGQNIREFWIKVAGMQIEIAMWSGKWRSQGEVISLDI